MKRAREALLAEAMQLALKHCTPAEATLLRKRALLAAVLDEAMDAFDRGDMDGAQQALDSAERLKGDLNAR